MKSLAPLTAFAFGCPAYLIVAGFWFLGLTGYAAWTALVTFVCAGVGWMISAFADVNDYEVPFDGRRQLAAALAGISMGAIWGLGVSVIADAASRWESGGAP